MNLICLLLIWRVFALWSDRIKGDVSVFLVIFMSQDFVYFRKTSICGLMEYIMYILWCWSGLICRYLLILNNVWCLFNMIFFACVLFWMTCLSDKVGKRHHLLLLHDTHLIFNSGSTFFFFFSKLNWVHHSLVHTNLW